MLKSVFLALFLVIIVVFGQDAPAPGASKSENSSKPTRKQDRNGCFSFRACGKEGVLQSTPIDSLNDKKKPVRNHACQCKDGRLMLVNWRGTAVSSNGAGKANIIVTQPDGTKIEIDPKDWALSLKQFPACKDIVPESLSASGVQPVECASNLVLGSTCTEGCAATLKALGQQCYSAAKYVIANPDTIKLSSEELFNNCVNREPYQGVKPTTDDKETDTKEEEEEDTIVEPLPQELEEEINNEKEEDTKVPIIPPASDLTPEDAATAAADISAIDAASAQSSATKVTTMVGVMVAAAAVLVVVV